MKEIFAQEGTPWEYPERYSFNDNLIELRDKMEFGMGTPLIGLLFINGTEVSLLNGIEMYHYKFGAPIIFTDKYIYIPLFEFRNEYKTKKNTFWERIWEGSGYYISRVNYSGNVEILSKKFDLVYLVKIEDDIIYYRTKDEGRIKSIKLPQE